MREKILPREFSATSIKESYTSIVLVYDIWSQLTESTAAKQVLDFAEIKDGQRVLEVAVGTGKVFKEIVKRNPQGKNEGIELSPAMLSRAKERLRKLGTGNYSLEIGSAYNLPFDSHSFNILINNFMLDLLPEKDFKMILSEFYRVIEPEGRIVISTMSFGQYWYNQPWYWVAKKFPQLLTGCRPVSIGSYMEEAGFTIAYSMQVSQNTFPAEVICGIKTAK